MSEEAPQANTQKIKTMPLTPEERKKRQLEALERGRQKAWARRREIGEIKRKEREMKLESIKKKIDERIEKVKAFEESKKPAPPPETEDVNKQKTKKKINIELSDSESDENSTDSESDESIEYVVQRKPKTKIVVKKQTKSKTIKEKPPSTKQITTEVAKQILKEKLMNDTMSQAMRSLFPYHNF